jgi:ubiquinol-cytochrome c reductase cytochrome c1 subunit
VSPVCSAGESSHAKGVFGKVDIDLSDKISLQRGAKYFVNYCLSCHPAKHSRYKRVADDLGIGENLMMSNMMFTGQKFGDLMTVAMRQEDAKKWFLGIAPPDLSTHTRAIGPQAVYEYLKSFYIDDSRPFGVNNLHLPNTAMPHILAHLQGLQKAEIHEDMDGRDKKYELELVRLGMFDKEEYDLVVTDIVNFLVYLSEPVQLVRKKIGIKVLFFLVVLGALSYFLKRDYWKDVH